MNNQQFKVNFVSYLKNEYGVEPQKATSQQIHSAISKEIMNNISTNWNKSVSAHNSTRRACYFSAEFLVGRAIYNNLLSLGIIDEVEEVLNECGISLSALEDIEDAALGNGGLGRLAACFLDSAATLNLPLDGYGMRYKYGLFKQTIVDGCQIEQADNWTRFGDSWSKRCEADIVTVEFADQKVLAVPYDMPIIGYNTNNISNLRLWQAEPLNDFDFKLFNDQKYDLANKEKNSAEDISRVLYPNDDTHEGKLLRLKQQYFFCSASITDIIKKYKLAHGNLDNFADFMTIQLNDTHPVISIPELIRQLIDNEGMKFQQAFAIAEKTFNYTNHTIMAEALEKWCSDQLIAVIPRVYEIIILINEEFIMRMYNIEMDMSMSIEKIKEMKIIQNDVTHMANLAIFASSYTNGVARLHTDILKTTALVDWFMLFPERFQNKTNGITQRRWLALCNPELSALITELLGNKNWITNLNEIKKLEKFTDDETVINKFISIKNMKKHQLSEFIKLRDGIEINPSSIFDIQIKRLHEYKRQLLNAFSILYFYFGIKDGSIQNFTPTTYIFGAKSAPGYKRAKGIIKFINEIAELVNKDEATRDLIKVVFVQNYNVSYAEKLVASADISEQISTAGTEASGTGNMKLMLNGAVTLGTYDGANVEIVEEAGESNNYIFGARVDELAEKMPVYDPRLICEKDYKIKRVINTLIDGTVSDGGTGIFKELYFALLDGATWHVPDHYYLIGDLNSYIEAKLRSNLDYKDKISFAKKCWVNMCNSGKFSSDRTIKDYAENIWKIKEIHID